VPEAAESSRRLGTSKASIDRRWALAIDALLDGDPTRVASFSTKFAGVVYPGEPLRTSIWSDSGRFLIRTTAPSRDDAPVLTDTILTVMPS